MEEILVKGSDGKWYIAREGKLVLQDVAVAKTPAAAVAVLAQPIPVKAEKLREQKIEPFKKSPQVPKAPVAAPKPVVLPAKVSLTAPHAPQLAPTDEMELVVSKTLEASGLKFNDPALQKRLKLLIASRLREVRRAEDVLTLLERDSKVGGMGLSSADSLRVSQVIESAFIEYHKKWQQVEEERKKAVAAEREKAARATAAVMSGASEKPIENKVEPTPAAVAPTMDEALQKQNLPSLPRGVIKEVAKEFTPFTPSLNKTPATRMSVVEQPGPAASTVAARQPSSAPTTPAPTSVTDIRRPKLLGPADEVRELKLLDWRRMGLATEAAMRIKAKIDLIGSESLALRREAVAAWKQSEVYRLYTDMASKSIAASHSIDNEISERMKSGKPCLNLDEFSAIMELNQALR